LKETSIEWADSTINFFMGCTKVSEGCKNCYMYRLMPRFGKDPFKLNRMNFDNIEKNLTKWSPRTIFVNSMSDTFHEDISINDIWTMFRIMGFHQKHTFIVLTKRITRARLLVWANDISIPDNVWLGTSVESQKYVSRIDELKQIKAKTKFVSFEPLLGKIYYDLTGINWAIVGGESDPNPRIIQHEWIDSIYHKCKELGIPFFFKQYGGSKKCNCHNAWGCRVYRGQLWDELPIKKVIAN